MLFQSSLNPDIKSTQDLIVLCHEQERVLVPLPKTYEDAQKCARDVFSLAGDVTFETSSLRGSVDVRVRIHSTAWEGVSPILDTVLVKSQDGPVALPRRSEVLSSTSRRLSSQKRAVAGPSAVPIRLSSVAAPRSPAGVHHTSSAKKAPVVASSSRTDSSTASVGSSSSKKPHASTSKATQKAPQADHAPARSPAKATAPPKTPEESEKDDEDEENIRIVSPTKKRVNRPRILSDYGLQPEEHADDGAVDASNSDASVEEEYDELEDTEFISAAPPAAKAPSSSSAQTRATSAVKPPSTVRSANGNGSLVQLDALPEARPVKEERQREASPKVKIEKMQAPKSTPTPASQSQGEHLPHCSNAHRSDELLDTAPSQSQGSGKSDESFVIMIEYNDDPESRSLFKTRGRHMVSKVLMQACRTFGLAEYYDSARLVLLVEDEEEGQVYRSVCNRNDTMAQAGAEPNARFVVEIQEGEEDD
ncbi:hypothetical protein OH77DRAFT_827251 [Trametes cingulata]|nr:hypothetical protein OH77DRAFT_827251 [Trametes cingulata]